MKPSLVTLGTLGCVVLVSWFVWEGVPMIAVASFRAIATLLQCIGS